MSEEAADWALDIDDLLRFSYQVAQGLDFLAAQNVSELITEIEVTHLKRCPKTPQQQTKSPLHFRKYQINFHVKKFLFIE